MFGNSKIDASVPSAQKNVSQIYLLFEITAHHFYKPGKSAASTQEGLSGVTTRTILGKLAKRKLSISHTSTDTIRYLTYIYPALSELKLGGTIHNWIISWTLIIKHPRP